MHTFEPTTPEALKWSQHIGRRAYGEDWMHFSLVGTIVGVHVDPLTLRTLIGIMGSHKVTLLCEPQCVLLEPEGVGDPEFELWRNRIGVWVRSREAMFCGQVDSIRQDGNIVWLAVVGYVDNQWHLMTLESTKVELLV